MTTPYETFEVEMHAFQNGVIREVRVPEDRLTGDLDQDLEEIFRLGQNDFQPVPGRCSVSCDDVIRYRGARYRVAPVGFELIA
jgi:hypothetical protein